MSENGNGNDAGNGAVEHRGGVDSALTRLVRERLGGRAFYALTDAIRDHESRGRDQRFGVHPHDEALYRALREVCAEL